MINFILKYMENKIISNIVIIFMSLVLAFFINYFLINNTNFWKNIKANLLEIWGIENKADIFFEKKDWFLYVISNKDIKNIKNLSLSFTYNYENISISNISSKNWDIINISNSPWIDSIVLINENKIDIKKWDKILKLNIIKINDNSWIINIINVNFKDSSWEIYLPTTSWIIF